MHDLTHKKFTPTIAVTFCALLFSACSGSSSTVSTINELDDPGVSADNSVLVSTPVLTDEVAQVPAVVVNDIDVQNSVDDNAVSSSETSDEPVDDTTTSTPETNLNTFTQTTVDVPISTEVSFDISVPVFVSNELQVSLSWGGTNFTADWVVDETWKAVGDFPHGASDLLVVTFSDRNGSVELGTYEQQLSIGSNQSENYLIQADQFDTARWDADGDGVSNLAELLANNDPLIDERLALDVRDSLDDGLSRSVVSRIIRDSAFIERDLPDERPYFEDVQTVVENELFFEVWGLTKTNTFTIDIDVAGNGTYLDFERNEIDPSDHTTIKHSGTRTNTGSSIHWMIETFRFSRSAGCNPWDDEFTTETTALSDGGFTQEGVHVHFENCSSSGTNFDTTYLLTGNRISDSSNCEAHSGTISATTGAVINGNFTQDVIISKATEDLYWKVAINRQGDLFEEYFVVDLHVAFFCDFPEL